METIIRCLYLLRLWGRKTGRFISSLPTILLLSLPLLLKFMELYQPPQYSPSPHPMTISLLLQPILALGTSWWILLGIVILCLFIQAYLEYRRRTYDHILAFQLQEQFDDLEQERIAVCNLLLDNRIEIDHIETRESRIRLLPLDDVLDFFEGVGFYMQGGRLTPEVAHHHFYHWIRMYWQAAQSYVQAWRQQETARWENMEYLFERTSDVEMSRGHIRKRLELSLTPTQLREYLEDERNALRRLEPASEQP